MGAAFNPALARNTGGYTYFQKLTGDDSDTDKSRWDSLYRRNKGYVYGREPAPFLVEALPSLPVGRALDLAMGEGRNSVYLAKKGFDVTGVDISEVAVRKARRLAKENNARIRAVVADLNKYQIAPESYDVILMFYYLDRTLAPAIVKGLKPGGVLVFENRATAHLKYEKGINKEYLIGPTEAKSLFRGLEIVKSRELDDGKEATTAFVARKPK